MTFMHVEITFCVWKSHSACINRTRACQNLAHACGNYIRACESHTLRSEICNIFRKFLDLLVASQAFWTFIIDLWLKRYQYIATYFILDTQDVLLKWVSCWFVFFLICYVPLERHINKYKLQYFFCVSLSFVCAYCGWLYMYIHYS
jgi:hypothetical protein